MENTLFSSTKGLRTGFGQDVLTKKETVFRLSLWWARRDLNLRHPARPLEDFLGVSGNEPSPFRPCTDELTQGILGLVTGIPFSIDKCGRLVYTIYASKYSV